MIRFLVRMGVRSKLRKRFDLDVDKLREKAVGFGATINKNLEVECVTCLLPECGACNKGRQVDSLKEELSLLKEVYEHQRKYI